MRLKTQEAITQRVVQLKIDVSKSTALNDQMSIRCEIYFKENTSNNTELNHQEPLEYFVLFDS